MKAIVLGLAFAAAATSAHAQSWRVQVTRDPFSDQQTYLASQNSRSHSMIVRCKDGLLEAYLVIAGYVGDSADVRYRFDRGEVRVNTWDASTDGTGVFAPGPGEFARSLMSAGVLNFEVTGEYGSPHQLRIPLDGSGAAIGRVLDGCAVPRSEIYEPDGPIWRRAVEAVDAVNRDNVEDLAAILTSTGHYDGPIDGTRRLTLYAAMSNFYEKYWTDCAAGVALTTSCTTWLSSRRYDTEADYPKEPVELLIEYRTAAARSSEGTPTNAAVRPPVITNPSWASQPRPTYPDRALELGLSGSAELSCTVNPNGALTACSIVSETPEDAGFGRAALAAAAAARLSPRSVEGVAPNGTVRFTQRFNLPD